MALWPQGSIPSTVPGPLGKGSSANWRFWSHWTTWPLDRKAEKGETHNPPFSSPLLLLALIFITAG